MALLLLVDLILQKGSEWVSWYILGKVCLLILGDHSREKYSKLSGSPRRYASLLSGRVDVERGQGKELTSSALNY